jgi:hypothetical protein
MPLDSPVDWEDSRARRKPATSLRKPPPRPAMQDSRDTLQESFSLFQFTLSSGVDDGAVQRSLCWGESFTVDEAFNAAKALVTRDHEAMRTLLAQQGLRADAGLIVIDTEHGYDLRHNGVIVSRYWIQGKPMVRQ